MGVTTPSCRRGGGIGLQQGWKAEAGPRLTQGPASGRSRRRDPGVAVGGCEGAGAWAPHLVRGGPRGCRHPWRGRGEAAGWASHPTAHLRSGRLQTRTCRDLDRCPTVLGVRALRPLPAFVPAGPPTWSVPPFAGGGSPGLSSSEVAPLDSAPGTPFPAGNGLRLTGCAGEGGSLGNCLPFSSLGLGLLVCRVGTTITSSLSGHSR